MIRKYRVDIGLEVHIQLNTRTKIFCGCPTDFGAPPNTHICPICLGLPGVLPVLNRKAVELAVKTALALNCRLSENCRFARKNYFYPDLPKGYQISQYSQPLATNGFLPIDGKVVRIRRAHLEEESGKSIHTEETSLLDFNRAGIPLLEVVTEPDLHSPEEAVKFLLILKRTLEYLEVSSCDMEKGSMRCEPNISIRKENGSFGVRTEIKNLNSLRFVEKALSYEIERQMRIMEAGGEVIQQTLLFDEVTQSTRPMRSKEEAEDYRYFPEPDLVSLVLEEPWVEGLRDGLPELPHQKRQRFIREYSLPEYDAEVLTSSKALASYFEQCVKATSNPKLVSNWIMTEVLGILREKKLRIEAFPVSPGEVSKLLALISQESISLKVAKEVFREMVETQRDPLNIVTERGLFQLVDRDELGKIVTKVLTENPEIVSKYKKGKTKVFSFLVGEVMRATGQRANPKLVNELLKKKLEDL